MGKKSKKPKIRPDRCKIDGCTGEPDRNKCFLDGICYVRGFCATHYNHYRIGLIDINGDPIERTRSLSEDVNQYNNILNKTVTISDKADRTAASIDREISVENPLFLIPENQKLREKVSDITESGRYIRSREFVIGSIEFIRNGTLRNILTRIPDKKKEVSDLNRALILKMHLNGKTMDALRMKFGHEYSDMQIENVLKTFYSKKK